MVAFRAVSWRAGARLGWSWAAVTVSETMSRRIARDWVRRLELMVCWRLVLMRSMAEVVWM